MISPYPEPAQIDLTAPIDDIEQGRAYGRAFNRGKDEYNLREKEHNIFWSACLKAQQAEIDRWEANKASREKIIEEANKLGS